MSSRAWSARACQALEAAGFRPDYFAVRQARDLSAPKPDTQPSGGVDGGAAGQGAADRQYQVSVPSAAGIDRVRATRSSPVPRASAHSTCSRTNADASSRRALQRSNHLG